MSLLEELKFRVQKYEKLTKQALQEVQIAAEKGTKDYERARQFIQMARDYFSDAKYYAEKGDNITALASFSYAHAWLDAGVKAGFLKGDNPKLFVQP